MSENIERTLKVANLRKNNIKMATLGDTMVKALFGQTEAEKTFRPWWDNLEDVLVYGLIILGK